MTDHASILKGGESGEAAIVAGKPAESYLLELITPENGQAAMPKDRPPLSAADVNLVSDWIAEGARDDTPAATGPAIDREHPPVYKLAPVITSLDFSPDGQLLAVSGFHEVLLHELHQDQSGTLTASLAARLVGLSERIESAVFSPDGKLLAVTGGSPGRFGELQIWDVASRELTLSLPVTYDTIYGASWSHDGTRVAFGCSDNSIRAVEVATGKQVLFNGAHTDWVLDTVWSKDSSHLVSVSRDRSMKLTEVKTQRFVDNITSITPGALKGGLLSVDRSPSGDELLIGGADGIPKLYQMHRTKSRRIGDDFNLIRKFPELPGRIFVVCFSPDGKQVLAGSSLQGRGEVRVFETADAKPVSTFAGQSGALYAADFQPNGSRAATGGFDGKVRINNVATGELVLEFEPLPLEDTTGEK